MISVLEHIEYLVMHHDYVVVPGWGAFIAQYNSSYCDGNGIEWHSPERQISFNSELTYSDGVLVNSIIRRESCSCDMANDAIRDNVEMYRRQLDEEHELSFGNIGMFRLKDGRVEFSPYSEKNIATSEFYGLGHFSMKPLSYSEASNAAETASGNAWRFAINKSYLKIAASILVLLVLSFVLTTPVPNKHRVQDYASISSMRFSVDDGMPVLSNLRELAITLPPVAEDGTVVKAYKSMGETAPQADIVDDKYFLIVCSALSQREADRFIAQQKNDYVFKVLAKKGRYRVYVATGNSVNELMKLKYKISNDFPDAWVHYSK